MHTLEIPREQWGRFFDGLSREHGSEPVRIEVLGADRGAPRQLGVLPLEGVGAHLDGGFTVISVLAGGGGARHVAHHIPRPRRVWILRSPGGDEEGIEIEADEGSTTVIHFEAHRGWRPRDAFDGVDG